MSRRQKRDGDNGIGGVEELRATIERIERLQEEKKALAEDIRDVKAEAKARGLSVKAIERILRERAETPEQKKARQETDELTDVYRAGLGMLDGTPLGDAARKRLSEQKDTDDGEADDREDDGGDDAPDDPPGPPDLSIAREAGKQAAREGLKVTANPFTAGDHRRAAWDEGWCMESASDGMEIPEAWRRKEKPKAKKDEPDGDGGEG